MIFLILNFFFQSESKSTTQIYYDLVRNGYDKFIRPNYLQSPVDVKIDIFMNSFGEIKAGDMSYRFSYEKIIFYDIKCLGIPKDIQKCF